MKLFMGVLFATLALNGVLSLPARTEDAEVIGGPRRILTRGDVDDDAGDDDDFTNFKGVIDTGSGYPFLQPNPSVIRVGFFDSFDDLFRRFSARLFPTGLFSRAGSDSDEDDSSELGISAIDPKKANSTSTVKVVDGHKVEVNETVYGDENSVFKVRVVNIRPLEEGETVDETEHKDIKPVTQGPNDKSPNAESSNESEERREPLEKKPLENEIQGNIDDPEHSIAKKENIVENLETTTTIDTTMLPTTEDINAAFVTDNDLEQQEYSAAAMVAEEELNGANGNGNNEFETNMSEENNSNNNNNNSDNENDSNDNIDNVENLKVQHTIENNEDTEEEVNDNLNESSSSSNADVSDKEQENNKDDDADDANEANEADIEIVNLRKKNSNYLAAIRHEQQQHREDESSSDDEDANASATEMHPTFNDEWGSLNEPTNEQNDFSNDIDVYDVLPIDLSNDIAVNDAANLPLNPDAEFIDVYGIQHSSNLMPKFEKLSLDYTPPSEEDWLNTSAK